MTKMSISQSYNLNLNLVSLTLLSLFSLSTAANIEAWKSRSVYQTMTDRFARTDGSTTHACNTTAGLYCGGTWRGTINHLDYIQGMGFDAVMISPIIENIDGRVSYGEAYHGYWPLNLYNLNDHFGTHQDLLDLSAALHKRGMYLMMDTVINNMAYMTNGEDPAKNIDYSVFTPFNNSDYFHSYCKITDWNNYTNAQLCQTGDDKVALPDLYTEHKNVQDLLVDWAKEVIKTYSVDGLRIDAAKHVNPGFLKTFGDSVDMFVTGEVLQREVDTICTYMDDYIQSVPNYPIYYSMLDAFTQANVTSLFEQVEIVKNQCNDVTKFVSFSENHDVARVPSFNDDMAIAKNVLTFTMLYDGIPMIYQGQEQHLSGDGTPKNRQAVWLSDYNTNSELYKLLAKLNALRKHVISLGTDYLDESTVPLYRGSIELAFSKGVEGRQIIMLLSGQGSKGDEYTLSLPISFNAGTTVTEVISCKNYTTVASGERAGELDVKMAKGEPKVFFPAELMEGSGLCGHGKGNVSFTKLVTGEDAVVYNAASSVSISGFVVLGLSVVVSVVLGLVAL